MSEREPDLRTAAGTGDPVADLVRLAAGRKPAPAETAERVKAAVRTRWQAEAHRRRRRRGRRLALAAAAAAIALVVVGLVIRRGQVSSPAAHVVSLDRGAWHRPAAGHPATPLEVGQTVHAGHKIATGAEGRLALALASGPSVRLDVDTRVSILSDAALRLEQGAVYVDADPAAGSAGKPAEILTDWGVIRDVGTQFEVRLLERSLRVRVREGLIVLEGAGPAHEVPSGIQLDVARDGTVARMEISPHGPEWEWVESIAPMIDLEGKTAEEFLQWIARERAWTLRFSDAVVAGSASRTSLSGSLDGLTLDEALDVVLPTCQLDHRLEGGTLVIQPAQAETG